MLHPFSFVKCRCILASLDVSYLSFNIKILLFRIHFIRCDSNTSLYSFNPSSWPSTGVDQETEALLEEGSTCQALCWAKSSVASLAAYLPCYLWGPSKTVAGLFAPKQMLGPGCWGHRHHHRALSLEALGTSAQGSMMPWIRHYSLSTWWDSFISYVCLKE